MAWKNSTGQVLVKSINTGSYSISANNNGMWTQLVMNNTVPSWAKISASVSHPYAPPAGSGNPINLSPATTGYLYACASTNPTNADDVQKAWFIQHDIRGSFTGDLVAAAALTIGVFIVCATAFQVVYGFVIHFLYDPHRKRVPVWDKLHWWLGRGLFIISLINLYLGLSEYNLKVIPSQRAGTGIFVVMTVWFVFGFGCFVAMEYYLVGAGFRKRVRQAAMALVEKEADCKPQPVMRNYPGEGMAPYKPLRYGA
ncbi:hypothetical protein HDU96_001229 [Phlyctochytrium bullatum]|nr:hypothetical protein HDU96_001229 [Phlyctochytrium bullatum]